jgi:GPH family glycoside/pentoside/hexuronide:cation symporter
MSDREAVQAVRSQPLTRGFKATYGSGAIAYGIVSAGFDFFLLFYLTAVCGMSGTLAGTAKMIALLVDAVLDPAIGLASDRVRSRHGRRVPFMIWSIVPFAAAFVAMFSIPASLSGVELFLYATACLVVLRVALSCFVLPFTAVSAEVTDDYRERASIVSYRLTFQNVGVLCCIVLGLGVFLAGSTGLLERENYVPFGWACAVLVVATGLLSTAAVRRVLPRLHGPKPEQGGFFSAFLREMIELARNRSFVMLFGTVLVYYVAYSAWSSLQLHTTRYFWGLDSFSIQLVLLSGTLGPLLGAPISAFALRYIERRTLAFGAFLAIALFQCWPPLFQLYGPVSLDPDVALVVLTINGLLIGTAMMIGGVGFQSMLADTADEHEWLFGVRREGLFYSGLTLAYKAGLGVGVLAAGVALDVIGFPTDLVSAGEQVTIPGGVLHDLALISGPLPAILVALAPLFLLGYHLTRRKHAEIIAGLEQRNVRNAGAAEAGE